MWCEYTCEYTCRHLCVFRCNSFTLSLFFSLFNYAIMPEKVVPLPPREPEWLRSYKTRAAPFSSTISKVPIHTPSAPTAAEKQHEPLSSEPQSDTNEKISPNSLSIAFPSTISLGLQSFAWYNNDAKPESSVHPALRARSTQPSKLKGTSDTSSTTIRAEKSYQRSANKDTGEKDEPRWKRRLKGYLRRLGCGSIRE